MREQLNRASGYFNFLDFLTVRLILALLVISYIAFGVYQIPLRMLAYLDSDTARIFMLAVILLVALRAPDVALLFALAYFTTVQVYRNRVLNLKKKN